MHHVNTQHQATVRDSFSLRGIGIHSGQETAVTVEPAQAGGIRFTPAGTPGISIPASVESVRSTARCTLLEADGARVATTEHLLAALWAMGVDHARVIVEGEELPALDGSAREYVLAIERVGLQPLSQPRAPITLAQPLWVETGDASLVALPAPEFRVTYALQFAHPLVGTQLFSATVNPESFAAELAPARTFGLLEWGEELRRRGLALGASPENTVVIGPEGYLTPLRFPDEFARHKALDLVGDLALLGRPLHAHVIGLRSGHAANAALAARISETPGSGASTPIE